MRLLLALLLTTTVAHAQTLPLAICDAHNSPKTKLARGGYAFCDPNGWITENEFIRRYRATTGAHDLDQHLRVRSRNRWILSAVVGAAGIGLLAYSLSTLQRPCNANDVNDVACIGPKQKILYDHTTYSVLSETLTALGGGMVVGATVVFFAGPGRDGSPLDHRLNRFAADLMVKRYQEARQTPAGEEESKLEIQPYVSGTGAGVAVHF
jgi:hypothetical protein